jgi:all-trans-8'-apo-beta-carotenal 15,15'-oxygenase
LGGFRFLLFHTKEHNTCPAVATVLYQHNIIKGKVRKASKMKYSSLIPLFLACNQAGAFLAGPGLIRPSTLKATTSAAKPVFASTSDTSSNTDGGTGTSTGTSSDLSINVDFKAYANGYKTVFVELPAEECKAVLGSIPSDLKGSYFRCGPAMFSAGSIAPPKTSIIQPREGPPVPDGQTPTRMVPHPFDADGGILGVTFAGDGSASARYRYVRTIASTAERRKGQRLYKGMDSTRELGSNIAEGMGNDLHTPLFRHHLQPGLNKKRKNTSNTRVIYWGKRLLSMWEGSQPYKMDGLALSTEGRSQLGGVLKEPDPFGSKMVVDPIKDRALFYGVSQDSKNSEVTVYEFNNKFRLVEEDEGRVTQELPGLAMFSDMAATDNYALFVQPPLSVAMQFMFVKEPGKVVTVEKSAATLHLVPRPGSKKAPRSITIPFDGVVEAEVQFINAFEDDGDKIIFDAIRSDGTKKGTSSKVSQWPWASSHEEYKQNASKKSLWRYEVDLKSGSVSKELLTDLQCFFGVVNPKQSTQKHNNMYMAVGGLGTDVAPPQGIARFNYETKSVDTWMPEGYEFCGEPMFAPKENPSSDDDGYILTVLFNGKTEQSELLVFKPMNISAGPVARIALGIGIPHGLHGCFTTSEEATWSFEEIQRRAKLADKMESRGDMWNQVKSDFSGLGLRFDDMEEYFGDTFLS